ncbi:uncharacterized protein LOC101968941 isoform X2 [Ictidomys tridecemlineatus]
MSYWGYTPGSLCCHATTVIMKIATLFSLICYDGRQESSTSQTRPKEEAARCQPSRPEEESPRRQPRPEEEARPAPCASPEEVHQPLKFIKGGVATSMVLWLIQKKKVQKKKDYQEKSCSKRLLLNTFRYQRVGESAWWLPRAPAGHGATRIFQAAGRNSESTVWQALAPCAQWQFESRTLPGLSPGPSGAAWDPEV